MAPKASDVSAADGYFNTREKIRYFFHACWYGFSYTRKSLYNSAVYVIKHSFTRLVSPVNCWHITHLPRHSISLMNERRSLHHFQTKVVCRSFFWLWLLKHWEIRIAYRQSCSNFPRKGRKTKDGKINQKLRVQWLWWWHFSRPRKKIDDWKFGTGRFYPCTWKISSVGKDQVDDWEFFVLKTTPIVCFRSVSTHFFISSLSAIALYDFYLKIVDHLFSFINKFGLPCQ